MAALLTAATGLFSAQTVFAPAAAQEKPRDPQIQKAGEKVWRHGLSLFGDIKYPADFKHFDYVNPQAPKGGQVRQSVIGTFDNFNIVVFRCERRDRIGCRPDLRYPDGTVAG